jgi:hypothetical protein
MSKVNIDAIKAAAYTALWVFIAMFGTALLGWLGDVTAWATDDGGTVVFPDPTALVKATVAAVTAGFSFIVAAAIRLAQANGILPGKPPAYVASGGGGDAGRSDPLYAALVVLVVVVILVILF